MRDARVFHAQVVAILLAVDIQARVVGNERFVGVEVRNSAHGQRIVWALTESGWGWTMITADGEVTSSMVPLDLMATPEDVAATIATTYQLTDLPSAED